MTSKKQPTNYARLREEQEIALQSTDEQIEQWEKFKSDYKALQQRLRTLPDKVSHEVMVPVGEVAFCPGRLVHTNEVLVLLGDNWFAERSARQAAEIVSRRITTVEKNLKELQEQRRLLLPRRQVTEEIQKLEKGGGEAFEIQEDYDPEAEEAWKEKHRASLRRQRRLEAEERERKVQEREKNKDAGKDPLWMRLEELERQEERRGELEGEEVAPPLPQRSDSSSVDTARAQPASKPPSQSRPSPSQPPPASPASPAAAAARTSRSPRPAGKRVQWQDLGAAGDASCSRGNSSQGGADDTDDDSDDDGDDDDDGTDDDDSSGEEWDKAQAGSEGRRPQSLKITFSHGHAEEQESESAEDSGKEGGEEAGGEVPEIRSPQDIYRLFCRPKSILKQSSADSHAPAPAPAPAPASLPGPDFPEKTIVSMKDSSAFTGTVVQKAAEPGRTAVVEQPPAQPAAKVSKFRARRQQQSRQHQQHSS